MLSFLVLLLPFAHCLGEESLPKVIVTPFKNSTGMHLQSTDSVTDTFISLLGQSKRFTVLEREAMNKIAEEKIAKGDYAIEGADYAFICNLATLDLKKDTFRVPIVNIEKEKVAVKVNVNVRIVEIKSSKIMFAASGEATREKEGSKGQLFVQFKSGQSELDNDMVHDAINESLGKVVTTITDNLFPIKVIAVRDGKVYINRGGPAGIQRGAVFKVYRVGEALVDTDTGLNLGASDTEIGAIRVTEPQDKYSIAEITEGKIDESAKGAVCRSPQIKIKDEKAEQKDKKKKNVFGF